ncbi:hypothetical protein C8T65DRAFT_812137 [Cerioporus squamosus]|nr:hypothetical protein C8T65DRAFT_812137 [Cerioporus squamosus]
MRQRLINISDQQRYGSWRSLSSFKGSLSMLFVLGLTCHVSHVDVGNDDDPDESFDLDMLHAVFMDTRPTQLTIRIWCPSHVQLPELARGLLSLCSLQEFEVVEMCKVRLTRTPGDRDYDVEGFLAAFCEAMASTEVDALKLRIDWSYLAQPPMNAEALADRLLDAVPSIRTAKVSDQHLATP